MGHKKLHFFLPFTLKYGLPKPSIEPTQSRFHPTFLAEMRFPILPPLQLGQASLRPVRHPLGVLEILSSHLKMVLMPQKIYIGA